MLWPKAPRANDNERRVDALAGRLVRPWRLEDVRTALERQFDTPIALSPWSTSEQAEQAGSFGSCGGMTIVGARGIAVRYDSRRSPAHQCRQVCHEFGHLQAGHHLSLGDRPNLRNIPWELMSDLDIGKAAFMLSRDIFIAPEELDAERRGMILAAGSTGGVEGGRWSIAGTTFGG